MLNIAVIGAGRIGAIHAANVAAHPNANLTWVADPVEGAAARLTAKLGGKATLDALEAVNAEDVDAIVVGSPTPTHVEMILAGIAAGKAVLCEKPVDLDIERALDCLRQVDAAKGKVMIGFNRRFDPTHNAVHEKAASGLFGKLEQLSIISRDPSAPPAGYIPLSGGIFRDMTIHDFDMARFFLGDIDSVLAVGQNVFDEGIAEAGDYDSVVVTLTAKSGAVGTITNSRRCAYGYDQRIEAFCSEGMIESKNQYPDTAAVSTGTYTGAMNRVQDFFLQRYDAAYKLELDAFITGVEEGKELSPSLADGCAALVLANAALESAKTGAAVKL
ncbi:MAG: inositol 2-dehydrogenase [Propionibacteriaceae bacterium]|nr:inositol 2-dehydrogenase [Propionibacteriaceae bacterium]